VPGFLIAINVYIISFLVPKTVPDPDLEIRGAVIQTLRKARGPGLQKIFFRPLGPQFGLKISGPGPPAPSPRSATEKCLPYNFVTMDQISFEQIKSQPQCE